MERSLHGDRDRPDIAETLHWLGVVSSQAGDLTRAKQLLEESLQMERSLHGDRDHLDIAETLLALGNVSYQAGDLTQAKQQFEESFQMMLSLHGYGRIAIAASRCMYSFYLVARWKFLEASRCCPCWRLLCFRQRG
jgi:tetratricopeptide (TPR) repeat protein